MIKSKRLEKEICITLANKVGALADISASLTKAAVNIEAVAGYVKEDSRDARIMLLTDNNPQAINALKEAGFTSVEEAQVLVIELENKAGALKDTALKLAANKIDIRYIYGTTGAVASLSRIVLSTSDNAKAQAIL